MIEIFLEAPLELQVILLSGLTLFIQMLEGLHTTEADLLINIKDKRLNQVYKGLTEAVVKEAFNWNDDFMKKA